MNDAALVEGRPRDPTPPRARRDRENRSFIQANLPLVCRSRSDTCDRGLKFLDMIRKGNVGLMRAVDKFEYQRGYKFSKYASGGFRQAITRARSHDKARTIRVASPHWSRR